MMRQKKKIPNNVRFGNKPKTIYTMLHYLCK